MKNEKLNKVLDFVVKIISIVSIVAQALKSAFPVEQPSVKVSGEDMEQIREFLNQGVK